MIVLAKKAITVNIKRIMVDCEHLNWSSSVFKSFPRITKQVNITNCPNVDINGVSMQAMVEIYLLPISGIKLPISGIKLFHYSTS